MTISQLFPQDFPDYALPTPAPMPVPQHDGNVRIHARMDQTILANIMLNHLWLVNSKRCACGMRSDQAVGKHYVWWTDHVAALIVTAGFSSGWQA